MRLEISKWNPFRFIRKRRGNGGEARGDSPLMMPESMGMMQDLLHDPAHARRLGENARRDARERFHIERFAGDWDRAFRLVTQ